MRRVTNDATHGDSVPGAAEGRIDFIGAVSIALDDLESGREVSLDGAATRLWLDRDKAPS